MDDSRSRSHDLVGKIRDDRGAEQSGHHGCGLEADHADARKAGAGAAEAEEVAARNLASRSTTCTPQPFRFPGHHQFQRPEIAISAGTSTTRISVASSATAN